ncbi:cupin domain-containing protein [Patulibacter americanus]|uniref:cupin domain-containing protein n=1 Tax=Patulibacter americanus TaxID=588672 RepID=UPI000683F3AE|nr:cupin domain-containing protein [Patulibacter americanus]
MPIAARHVEFTARAGEGERLCGLLVEVGEALRGTAGCESWIVSRVPGEPDRVVVDERWADRATMDAAAAAAGDDERLGHILELLDPEHPPRRTELEPVGGAGLLPRPRAGLTHLPLLEAEDQAAAYGFSSQGESRFPTEALGLERTGIGHHRMPASARSAFGHRHAEAEEVYVVLAGAGRAAVGDRTVELRPRDALRVAPGLARAFEAGADGLELLAVGPRHPGDGDILPGWFGDDGDAAAGA